MKKVLPIFSFILFIQLNTLAQQFPYTLTTLQEEYVPLSEALVLTPTDDANWDDPELGYYLVPLGFDFEMMGRIENNIALIDPGCQVVLGALADTVNVLSPYFADIRNADTLDVVSSILYSTEGAPGNQIFKLEWQNVGFFNEYDVTGDFISTSNFQVWFYETTNIIEFRFGPNTIKDGTLIHNLWPAPFAFFIQDFIIETQLPTYSWSLMGPSEDPTVGPIDMYAEPGLEELMMGEPSNGVVYRFAPIETQVVESTMKPTFSVYPSSASQTIWINYNGAGKTDLRIFDLNGNLVAKEFAQPGIQELHISNWANGTYLLTIGEGPSMQTQKIIKQ